MTTIKDFYIGENDGSGIQAKSKEEFFEYLEEKIQEAEKAGKTTFNITIENREITWKKSLMIFWKQQTTTTWKK